MPRNQFYPDKPVPPEKFVCRTSELSTIFDKINSRDHVAIFGSSGMGKTSLLRYIENPKFWEEKGLDFSEALIVYHNCELSVIDSFWQEVLTTLIGKATGDQDLVSKINALLGLEKIEITDIRELLREIGKRGKFLLLLLDDYHIMLGKRERYPENQGKKSTKMLTFLSELRNLAVHNREGQYFSTIVATFQKLHELGPAVLPGGSPWYNHYAYLPLKPFSKSDIEGHFFNRDSHFFISDAPKEEVLKMTGGYPALLQLTGDIFSRLAPVNVDTLNTNLKNGAKKIFQDVWNNFEKNEQEILQLILINNSKGKLRGISYSIAGIEKEFIRNISILNSLEEKGFISQVKQANKYSFTSSLMENFIGDQLAEKNVSNAKDRKIVINLFIIKITLGQWKKVKEKIQPVTKFISPLAKIIDLIANKIEGK